MQQVTEWSREYDVNTFLQQLPAYDLNPMTDELLQLSREINYSGNYYWMGAAVPVVPQGATSNIAAYATMTGSIAVPPGSYVISLTHYSDQTEGIKVKIYDKGTKASIFYGDYSKAAPISSAMVLGVTAGDPYGPGYLISPFIVTPPGNINWEVVNLSASAAIVQVMFQIAVPITNMSIGTKEILR